MILVSPKKPCQDLAEALCTLQTPKQPICRIVSGWSQQDLSPARRTESTLQPQAGLVRSTMG